MGSFLSTHPDTPMRTASMTRLSSRPAVTTTIRTSGSSDNASFANSMPSMPSRSTSSSTMSMCFSLRAERVCSIDVAADAASPGSMSSRQASASANGT
jgi:hypothetical protein